ncbi:MAG: 23S rRNA (uracil(1939)-C(5))-methyltransferase RlmD [Bacteroidales bacterium]|nr:23S rRNA (uracil(1939)-C(5))-methyltransferase RlmD [Bacteroidales bacterium]
MARKRKELPVLEDVEILDVAAEGNALARVDEMVVFVPFGAPGDRVDIKIEKKKKSYAQGRIEKMRKESPIRVAPKCAHFTVCGGCRWQHLPYDFQLKCKRQQVVDALERIAKVELPEIPAALGSDKIWEYRNKMEYTFSNRCWLTFEQLRSGEEFPDRDAAGFHIPGSFDKVLDIGRCYLQDDISNRMRHFIKDYGKAHGLPFYDLKAQCGFLRTMMVRVASTGEIMVVLSVGEDRKDDLNALLDAFIKEFPQVTSLMYVVNTKVNDTIGDLNIQLYAGKEYIEEEMEGLRFRVGPKSFYQTNSLQAYELYKVVRDFAQLTGSELVYDLYTGTGTIANFVSRKARKVVGVEYVEAAIEDARINSSVNGIDNTIFFAGDMKDVLTDDFIAEHGHPDVMIVDPPRAGMHANVVDTILRAEPPVIVYVSCNPATQARDLALLDVKYKVEAVQPVDMFPHTQHVENVVRLVRRPQPKESVEL